ncbi:MFS transporter [Streptomyces violarus]|uniref:EmrB/QacA subfamily drug resistance transporter n=1 Tax=Streptomyces violarus TaxID=67380 RepID=A0A7W4ZSZ3_9ACTN|nr:MULTISPECIES: MFS transporter [Streptomyces]MBB3078098.1 EmrB/QacA subfamily drug resistance transporter [Streptomyces violarus]WRT99747.1 MFS transporter [Streptomyces sp. CGMCC 4.1772]GHD19677.1 MFS transporter [Streptomyces violarus]
MTSDTRSGNQDEEGLKPPATEPAAAIVRNPWATFRVLVLIEFITVLDISVVNMALPSIQRDLGFSATGLVWVVDAFVLAYAGFLLLAGRAADVLGRKWLFLAGVGVFTLASLGCAAATEDWHLVVSRVVQGLGAAIVVPTTLALITDIFPEGPQRNRALGIASSMGSVAAAAGVLVGGLLADIAWQWAFLVNVPIGAVVFVAGFSMVPDVRARSADGIDVLGALTLALGVCALLFVVIRGGAEGWASGASLGGFALTALLLAVFVWRQRTARLPLIPTALLRQRNLVVGNAAIFLVGALMFGVFLLITLYLQHVRGYGPAIAGLMYLPIPVATFVGTQIAPRILRFGPRTSLLLGLVTQFAGLLWWAVAIGEHANPVLDVLAPTVLWSLGVGVSIVSAYVVCTLGVPAESAGAASGLATTSHQVGGAIGLSVLVAVADDRTRSLLDGPEPVSGATALTGGYAWALWGAVGIAAAGALLTRLMTFRTSERTPDGSPNGEGEAA